MTAKRPTEIQAQDKLLPRLTSFFFKRPRITAVIWIVLLSFGLLSYTTLLRREGFPSVTVPIAIVNGTSASENPQELDTKVTQIIARRALKDTNVSTVATQTVGRFYNVTVQYKDGVDAKAATNDLKKQVAQLGLPADIKPDYNVPYFGATGGDLQQIDIAVSYYATQNNATTPQLISGAHRAVDYLNGLHVEGVKQFSVKDPFGRFVAPDGTSVEVQKSFDRVGFTSGGRYNDATSVIIVVEAKQGSDAIKLYNHVQTALDKLAASSASSIEGRQYGARISASFAPSIKDNISELQRVLLEGLVIVLIVGSIIIAVRASLITVLSMLTVIALTIGLLYLVGYTLNVITLFALILGLSLIVDDTTIMVEAIDAGRRKSKDSAEIVAKAARKVSRAMLAATITAALSFAPFLFVGGVLGSFIRAIPVTIIASLIISLFVALIFIPFFSRFSLLTHKQLTTRKHNERAAKFEAAIARGIGRPMLWARHSKLKLLGLGVTAIALGLAFLIAGGFLSSKVVFNIFPASKDTNELVVTLNYPGGTTIEQAQQVAAKADKISASVLKDYLLQSSYYGLGDTQMASQQLEIVSYTKRSETAPQLVKKLQQTMDTQLQGAKATVNQVDLGPPSSAFIVQIKATNREAALKLANDVAAYMREATLTRVSGKQAHFTQISTPNPSVFTGAKGQPNVQVGSSFDGTDTTTLVTLGQKAVNKEFTVDKIKSYGLDADSLSFDLGQESQNQDSFKTLALAFPILLVIMYLVLVLEFRSFLQPLLIFMAIPFSVFGVMLGLFITNNPISFFALLGFFALIGLSIKNTILLTDFANQSRRAGMNPVDAAIAALHERFRPLIATSLIAVLSLVPLAITSPFWQGLAVVLIFGLLSSTMLVITVFPYYYLGAEYMRAHISRKGFRRMRAKQRSRRT